MAKPVFYDPRQARWKRLRRLFDIAALAISLVVVFFIYNALHSEQLPELLLQTQKRPYHSLSEKEKEKAREKRRIAALRRGQHRPKESPSQVPLNAEEGVRAAFYVPWDAASFASLREYAHQVDLLYPEWLHVLTPDGHLQGEDPETIKYFDVVQGKMVHSVDNKVMSFLKSEGTSVEVFPLVNNFDGTSWIDISSFLDNPDARALFRQQVAAFLGGDQYRGLMVDFEDFPKAAQPGYVALLQELPHDFQRQPPICDDFVEMVDEVPFRHLRKVGDAARFRHQVPLMHQRPIIRRMSPDVPHQPSKLPLLRSFKPLARGAGHEGPVGEVVEPPGSFNPFDPVH